jgi:hypothetical protein
MDTSGQLQLLQLSADELRKSLPPAMHEERLGGDVLDHLNRQLHEIEARVQSALLRALQARQEEEEEEDEDEQMVTAAEGGEEYFQQLQQPVAPIPVDYQPPAADRGQSLWPYKISI